MAAFLAALVAAVLLAACSGDPAGPDQPEETAAPAPVVPPLEKAWSTSAIDRYDVDAILRVGDVVVVQGSGLTGLDAASGTVRWRLKARAICAFPETAPDGLVVIGYQARAKDDGCATLAAIDAATGKIAWQRRIGDVGDESPTWRRLLAVGDSTVTLERAVCGELRRFDLRTGKPLRPIRPVGSDGYACDRYAIDGQWIAHLATSDFGGRDVLTLYDADTGKLAFRRPFSGRIGEIYSSDPLVMDLTIKGHRLLWQVDPHSGKVVAPVSAQVKDYSDDGRPYGLHDGLVVAEWGDALTRNSLAAFDPATAKTVWSGFPKGGSVVGLDSGLIVQGGLLGDTSRAPVITRHSFSDVTKVEVLGSLESRSALGLAGDLLLVDTDNAVTAYRLPAPGAGPQVDPDLDLGWDEQPFAPVVDETRWQDGEFRPEGDVETCPLADETLTRLGFHRVDLPRPLGCEWFERQEPPGTERDLNVATWVSRPVEGETTTATQKARDNVRQALKNGLARDNLDVVATKVAKLRGVGDEAYVVHGAGTGGRNGNVSLLVRVANVVVRVEMKVTTEPYEVSGAFASSDLEEGAWSAVEDVLAGMGLSITRPVVSPPPTPALRPQPDLCTGLGPSVAALVPATKGTDLRPRAGDGRVAGCAWDTSGPEGNHDAVQVSMYAVPSSTLTGTPGATLAKRAFAYTTKADSFEDHKRRVDGVGDQARVVSWDTTWIQGKVGDADRWTGARVDVRAGNLSLVVIIQKLGWSTASLEERAIELARQALGTQRGGRG